MKNKLMMVAFLGAALGLTSMSEAAFTSVATSVVPATASVTGTGVARVDLGFRYVSNPLGPTVPPAAQVISWSDPKSEQGWQLASKCLVIHSTVTDLNGGVEIFTDNTSPDGPGALKFFDPTPAITTNPDSNPAGLLLSTGGVPSRTSVTLPLAWSIKASTVVPNLNVAGRGIVAANPNDTSNLNSFQWNFMTDVKTPDIDFGNGIVPGPGVVTPRPSSFESFNIFPEAIYTLGGSDSPNPVAGVKLINYRGIHGVQGPDGFFTVPDGVPTYLYFQADFSGAAIGQKYQTNTININSYTN